MEQDGADLLKRVLEKVGSYTDVLVSIGSWAYTTPLLEQSLNEFRRVRDWCRTEKNFNAENYIF